MVRGQRSEVRGQRSEVRGQRSEVRGQRSEVRGWWSVARGWRNLQFAICILQFAICNLLARADSPVAVPVDGVPSHAELAAVDAKWQITFLVGGERKTMPAADLVRWGQCPEQGRAGGLVLADGSFLVADVNAADKDRLSADSDLFGTQKVPLEALSGVILHPPSSQQDRDKLFDRLVSPLPLGEGSGVRAVGSSSGNANRASGPHPSPLPEGEGTVGLGEGSGVRAASLSDRLLLDNGDELAGLFEGIANDVVTLRGEAGPIEVKTDRVTAIVFNPALKRRPAKTGRLRVWAGFSDGSRLLATELLVAGKSLKLTAAGQAFAAAARDVVFAAAGRPRHVSLRPYARRIPPDAVFIPCRTGC